MPVDKKIFTLNREVTIKKYSFAKDELGGNMKYLATAYPMMVNIEPISNTYILEQLKIKYGEGYRLTLRYEPSRILTPNDEIVYQGKILKTQGSPLYDSEFQKRFITFNVETSDVSENSGGGYYVPLQEYHAVGTGQGDLYSIENPQLKGWTGTILFFKDKFQFQVIRTGMPNTQQVLYNITDGSFSFPNVWYAGEPIDIYLINQ